jgi:hypothetical protein
VERAMKISSETRLLHGHAVVNEARLDLALLDEFRPHIRDALSRFHWWT